MEFCAPALVRGVLREHGLAHGVAHGGLLPGITHRSLERRLRAAHIGRFKPLCDFDWTWPKRCDRSAFEALMALDFLKDATNAILVGPNGVGKSTLARNIAHQALIHGHTVLFTSLSCSASSPHSTAIPPCAGARVTMPAPVFW